MIHPAFVRAPARPLRLLGVLALLWAGCPAAAQRTAARSAPAHCAADSAPVCLQRGLQMAYNVLHAHRRQAVVGGRLDGALVLLRGACAQGLGDGCYFAGRILPSTLPDDAPDSVIHASHATSLRLFIEGCHARRPSGDACNGAGNAFAFGLGTEVHEDSASAYFGVGCGLRNATACFRDGYYLSRRDDLGPHAWDRAEARSREACRMGSPGGCGNMAWYAEQRLRRAPAARRGTAGFLSALDTVRSGYETACGGGQMFGCNNLGKLVDADGLAPVGDREVAAQYYRRGCAGADGDTALVTPLGYGSACYNLGQLALAANPPDSARARRLATAGCQLFDADSCVSLGRMDQNTTSSAQHYANVFLFAEACISSSGYGCDHLGWAFEHDRLLADTAQAREYYLRACELEDGYGCGYLGLLRQGPLLEVRSAPPERVHDAIKFYRRGCDLEIPDPCMRLAALMYVRYGDQERYEHLNERACAYRGAAGCWALVRTAHARDDPVRGGTFRSAACRLDAAYCKKKFDPDLALP